MKKLSFVIICIILLFSFNSCKSNIEFTSTETGKVIAQDGTEYTNVGLEGSVCTFGNNCFLGHISGEKKSFNYSDIEIKTGMYSVDDEQDVLVRYFPDNEFAGIYVKSGLLKKEVAIENCIRFEFAKNNSVDTEILNSQKGISECKEFLNDIKKGQTAKDAELYDLVKQPDGSLKNCYVYGYVYGFLQEGLNLAIPMEVISFDDKAYSITIDDIEYVLSREWIDKLSK